MKKIILLSSLSFIFFASECRAMDKKLSSHSIDEEELSRHFNKTFISPPAGLQLDSESETEASQEDFKPVSSWQDESLLEDKENTPPQLCIQHLAHLDRIAKLVDDALGTNQDTSKSGPPGLQRRNAFHIPR